MEHVEDASDACLFVRLGGRPNLERIVYELYDPGPSLKGVGPVSAIIFYSKNTPSCVR